MKKNLILFGFQASGKTTLGKRLAQKLEFPFVDTDQEIEWREKLSCREICLRFGEDHFRMLEAKIVDTLHDRENALIAVGGGTLLFPENYQKLKRIGHLIYLRVEKRVIKERIFSLGVPSYLDPENPERSFERMYAKREPIYESIAEFTIPLDGQKE